MIGQKITRELHKYALWEFNIIGYIDDDSEKIGTEIEGIQVLGNLNQAQDVVLENNIHHVIMALPLEKYQLLIPVS